MEELAKIPDKIERAMHEVIKLDAYHKEAYKRARRVRLLRVPEDRR